MREQKQRLRGRDCNGRRVGGYIERLDRRGPRNAKRLSAASGNSADVPEVEECVDTKRVVSRRELESGFRIQWRARCGTSPRRCRAAHESHLFEYLDNEVRRSKNRLHHADDDDDPIEEVEEIFRQRSPLLHGVAPPPQKMLPQSGSNQSRSKRKSGGCMPRQSSRSRLRSEARTRGQCWRRSREERRMRAVEKEEQRRSLSFVGK